MEQKAVIIGKVCKTGNRE